MWKAVFAVGIVLWVLAIWILTAVGTAQTAYSIFQNRGKLLKVTGTIFAWPWSPVIALLLLVVVILYLEFPIFNRSRQAADDVPSTHPPASATPTPTPAPPGGFAIAASLGEEKFAKGETEIDIDMTYKGPDAIAESIVGLSVFKIPLGQDGWIVSATKTLTRIPPLSKGEVKWTPPGVSLDKPFFFVFFLLNKGPHG